MDRDALPTGGVQAVRPMGLAPIKNNGLAPFGVAYICSTKKHHRKLPPQPTLL